MGGAPDRAKGLPGGRPPRGRLGFSGFGFPRVWDKKPFYPGVFPNGGFAGPPLLGGGIFGDLGLDSAGRWHQAHDEPSGFSPAPGGALGLFFGALTIKDAAVTTSYVLRAGR